MRVSDYRTDHNMSTDDLKKKMQKTMKQEKEIRVKNRSTVVIESIKPILKMLEDGINGRCIEENGCECCLDHSKNKYVREHQACKYATGTQN